MSRGGPIMLIAVLAVLAAAAAGVLVLTADGGDDTAEVRAEWDDGIASVSGQGSYPEGESVLLTAVLQHGRFFDGWYSADGALLGRSLSLSVTADGSVLYARSSEMLTVSISSGPGILSLTGAGMYAYGESVTLNAEMTHDHDLEGWYRSDGCKISGSSPYTFDSSVCTSCVLTLEARTVPVVFAEVILKAGEGIESVSGSGTYRQGETAQISASTLPGYGFSGWFLPDGTSFSGDPGTSFPAEDIELTAEGRPLPPSQLTVRTDAGISSVSGDGKVPTGEPAVLRAELSPGYSFDGWYDIRGGLITHQRELRIVVRGDMDLYARSEPGYTVHSLGMNGVTVPGREVFGPDEKAAVTATEGDLGCFLGWYAPDGELVSTETTFRPDMHDGLYIAKTSDHDFSGGNPLSIGRYPKWYGEGCCTIVLDYCTNSYVASYMSYSDPGISLEDGRYRVIFYNCQFDASARYDETAVGFGDTATHYYYWNYAGEDYSAYWEVPMSVYYDYGRADVPRRGDLADLALTADHRDANLIMMADFLKEEAAGMTPLQTADFVLKFVQLTTSYETDSDFNGHPEYWKHPMETLLQARGDCEDTSVLYVSLIKAMGMDAVLLGYTSDVSQEYAGIGHAAAAVRLDSVPGGTYYPVDGGKYYYCETTSDTMDVGQVWDRYDTAQIIRVP